MADAAAVLPAPGPDVVAVVADRPGRALRQPGLQRRPALPTQAQFDAAAQAMSGNAAYVAMAGPARALDTTGGQTAWQSSAFGAVLVGLMSMALIGRHTRAEEESGRDELVRASAVGRSSTTVAAAVLALLANLVIGLAVGALARGVRSGRPGLHGARPRARPSAAGCSPAPRWWPSSWPRASAAPGASPGWSSPPPTCCGRWGTSATGWPAGSRRSAGTRRCTRSRDCGGGRRCSCWPRARSPSGPPSCCSAGGTSRVGVLATRPGPARAPASLRSSFGLAWRLQRPHAGGLGAGDVLLRSGLRRDRGRRRRPHR